VDGGNNFQTWKAAGNVPSLNKQSWSANKEQSLSMEISHRAQNVFLKNQNIRANQMWMDSL
jgi:hypothetical protein